MSNIAYSVLMNSYARAAGFNPGITGTSDWDEVKKEAAVDFINTALRWACVEFDPEFCWPWLMDDATLTPASGLLTRAQLSDSGDGTWCSLWTEDPRTETGVTQARRVLAEVSHDGVHILDGTTSVFAFYRKATPQGTWEAGSSYSSPSTIPEQLREMIMNKAVALRHESEGNWEAFGRRNKDAENWVATRKAGLLNKANLPWDSSYAWLNHFLTL